MLLAYPLQLPCLSEGRTEEPAMTTSPTVIRLAPVDQVAVAVAPLVAGDQIRVGERQVTVLERIPAGHKVSLLQMAVGATIRKYGQPIGVATQDIQAGSHVHDHNCAVMTIDRAYTFATDGDPAPRTADVGAGRRSFAGYVRTDGRVGTRNYVAVISMANCSASVSRLIANGVKDDELSAYPAVDGVLALTHKGGCSMPSDGAEHLQLERVLAGFAQQPNVGGYIIVGLGCEVAQASRLIERQNLRRLGELGGPPVLVIQEEGGVRRTVEEGLSTLRELLPTVASARRVEVPASRLVLGLQCGGSDGYSGITANPALGVAVDLLVAQGGTAVLGETPEIYGAEHLLARRAVDREVGEALIERIRWWEAYAASHGATIDNNPTPGNKAGGLTTILEKSLGAVAKAGSTPLTAVYQYAEQVSHRGLVLMDTPGNDPVSLTGIVAGGATICAFTTGRGSVYGCKPSPCIKISTNSSMYRRMEEDMDLDAGVVLSGTSVEEVGRAIFEEVLAVASGKRTKSEAQGLGDEEFAPWMLGPIL
jgi:altronate hydrolase